MTYIEYKTAIDAIHERMNTEGVNNQQLQNDLRLLESIYRNELREALELKINEMDEKELDANIAKMGPNFEERDKELRAIFLDSKVNEYTNANNIKFTNIKEVESILDMHDRYFNAKIDYVEMMTKASTFEAAMSWFKMTDFYKNNKQNIDAFESQMKYRFQFSEVVERSVVELLFNDTMGDLINNYFFKSNFINEHYFEPEFHDRKVEDPLTIQDILGHLAKKSGMENHLKQRGFETYFKTTEFAKLNPDFSISTANGDIDSMEMGIRTLRTLKDVYKNAYQKYAEEREKIVVKPQEEIKGKTQTIQDKKAYLLELVTGGYTRSIDVNKTIQNSEMLQGLEAQVPELEGFDHRNKEGISVDEVLSTSSLNLGGLGSAIQELSGLGKEQEEFYSLLQNYEAVVLPTYNAEVGALNGQREQYEAQLKEAQNLVASAGVQLSVKQNEKVNIFNKNKHNMELAQCSQAYNEAKKREEEVNSLLDNIKRASESSYLKLNTEYTKLIQYVPHVRSYLPHQLENIKNDAKAYFELRKNTALQTYREAIRNYVSNVSKFFKTTPEKLYERFSINLEEFQSDILNRITLMAQALNEAVNLSVQDEQVLDAMRNAAGSDIELAQEDLNTIINEESQRHR